jgi:hypothetical protein
MNEEAYALWEGKSKLMVTMPNEPLIIGKPSIEGGFEKRVILAYSFNNEDEKICCLNILKRIVVAGKWTDNDVYYLGFEASQSFTLLAIIASFTPASLVFFGISPAQLKWWLEVRFNNIVPYQKTNCLFTQHPLQLDAQKELKLAFWEAWKKIIQP